MRIFLGLTEIAGYFSGLKLGFKRLGVPCCFLTLTDHRFGYAGSDTPNALAALVRWFARQKGSDRWPRFVRKNVWRPLMRLATVPVFLWALARHDVFILGYHSRFGFYDLPLLKLFGRKVIHVFFGSDSRPAYIDGAVGQGAGPVSAGSLIRKTRKNKRFIRRVEKYADHIVSYPLHSHLHERELVFSSLIGFPVSDSDLPQATATPSGDGRVRILHCPSDPVAKGSEEIARAIRSLMERGLDLEFITITGQPNSVVREELARCDIVVDQLYNEAPIAGIVAEAASFGKPVVVGSYGRGEIERVFPPGDMFPVHLCHPTGIEAAIERLATDAAYRADLGRRALRFMRERWTPEKVAGRYLELIGATPDPSWMFDPHGIRHVQGACLSEERARARISAVVETGGKVALGLDDKPDLLRRMLEFGGISPER